MDPWSDRMLLSMPCRGVAATRISRFDVLFIELLLLV